jgi:hypothetical protein
MYWALPHWACYLGLQGCVQGMVGRYLIGPPPWASSDACPVWWLVVGPGPPIVASPFPLSSPPQINQGASCSALVATSLRAPTSPMLVSGQKVLWFCEQCPQNGSSEKTTRHGTPHGFEGPVKKQSIWRVVVGEPWKPGRVRGRCGPLWRAPVWML